MIFIVHFPTLRPRCKKLKIADPIAVDIVPVSFQPIESVLNILDAQPVSLPYALNV